MATNLHGTIGLKREREWERERRVQFPPVITFAQMDLGNNLASTFSPVPCELSALRGDLPRLAHQAGHPGGALRTDAPEDPCGGPYRGYQPAHQNPLRPG